MQPDSNTHTHTHLFRTVFRALAGNLIGPPGPPIVQIVVDHHRCLLYSLHEDGRIYVMCKALTPLCCVTGLDGIVVSC